MTGDAQLATLIALDAGRPHLLLDAAPERTPWLTPAKFNETGGVVVWRASDTVGTPPADIAQRFPGLVPEVPRAFEWLTAAPAVADRLGHRAAEGAVAVICVARLERIERPGTPCSIASYGLPCAVKAAAAQH